MQQLIIGQAIGHVDGDHLTLENQWAKVAITREDHDNGFVEFVVTGDCKDFRKPRMIFATVGKAMVYAMESLAEYAAGAMR